MTGQRAAATPHGHGARRTGRRSATTTATAAYLGGVTRPGRRPGRGVRGVPAPRARPWPRLPGSCDSAAGRAPGRQNTPQQRGFRSSPAGSETPAVKISGCRDGGGTGRGGDAATAVAEARGLLLAGAEAAAGEAWDWWSRGLLGAWPDQAAAERPAGAEIRPPTRPRRLR